MSTQTPGTPRVPTPKSLYPDTPWWSNLVTAVVVATFSILGTAYALKGSSPPSLGRPDLGAAAIAVDTITYMPHILLLFGVLADMFTYQGVWSIPSLVGLLSIFMNYLMQYFWMGIQELYKSGTKVASVGTVAPTSIFTTATAAEQARFAAQRGVGKPEKGGAVPESSFFTKYDGCSVQGFQGFRTEFAPQTLVVTATVFCYYIFDIVRNRGWLNAAASIVMFGFFYIMQVAVLSMYGGCGSEGAGYSDMAQATMALFEGIVFGGSAYGIVQTYFPNRLPSSVVSPFPTKNKNELTAGPDGRMYDSDGYPYVVLPNGQAVPDLSTQQARDAFAQLAGQNLGTGTPAKPDNCPS
jgi:hypothetical protein